MTWLLRLYPRQWRERYGDEIEEIVAAQPASLQMAIDLIGGAVDAHLNPGSLASRLDEASSEQAHGGHDMVNRLKGDQTTGFERKDAMLGAVLTLGSAAAVAAIIAIGDSEMSEAVGLTMIPGVLGVGTLPAYLRGHSTLARTAVITGTFAVLLLIGLTAGFLVTR